MAQVDIQSYDEYKQPLYESRKAVYPKSVDGFFRRLKWVIMIVTLGIYYVTPWIRFPRGEGMPDQAVLVDLASSRFFFFWIEIWPNEFYYVAGLLIMAGIGLFLFTSVLGRVWCGYTCPQTVWVDLFQHVERFVDGDRNAQIRLAKAPLGVRKAAKRLSKWSIWLLISVATGGAWVFYFADAPTLAGDLASGSAPMVAYLTIGILTATTFVFGGFMREQVCIYMCPWPRIQAAMTDKNSLIVTYKDFRGEPRGKLRRQAEAAPAGDCVDCHACVAVCPTGVDIRDGNQLGCINCALCIDACDDVMKKIGRPRGLIDYASMVDCEQEAKGGEPTPLWRLVVRPRTILYTTLWAGIGVAMLVTLFMRDTIDLSVAHARNPQFITLSDGGVRNIYELKISNRHYEAGAYRVSITGPDGASSTDLRLLLQDTDPTGVVVPADSVRRLTAFIVAPAGWTPPYGAAGGETEPVRFWAEHLSTRERISVETHFAGADRIGPAR